MSSNYPFILRIMTTNGKSCEKNYFLQNTDRLLKERHVRIFTAGAHEIGHSIPRKLHDLALKGVD